MTNWTCQAKWRLGVTTETCQVKWRLFGRDDWGVSGEVEIVLA